MVAIGSDGRKLPVLGRGPLHFAKHAEGREGGLPCGVGDSAFGTATAKKMDSRDNRTVL